MIISSIALTVGRANRRIAAAGKRFGDPGFIGEPINLNVVNADIRDILNYITNNTASIS
jgi:hypothetical protein